MGGEGGDGTDRQGERAAPVEGGRGWGWHREREGMSLFLWKLGLPSASDLELGKLVFPEC